MKRLLLVTYFFPPLGGVAPQRPLRFARYLPELGWDVTVLAPREAEYRAKDELHTDRDQLYKVVRTRSMDSLKRGQSYRARLVRERFLFPDERALWRLTAVPAARRLARKADVILSTSPPVSAHLVAMNAAERTGTPWIADFRDPYVTNPNLESISADVRHVRLEERLLRVASAVTVVTPEMREDFAGRTVAPVHTITNGYDPDELALLQPEALSGRVSLLHAGSLYGRRSLEPVVRALELAVGKDSHLRGQLRVHFVGFVDEDQRELALASGVSDMMEFTGFVPRRRALEMMLGADALLLIVSRDMPHAATGKVFDYIASRRPIVGLVPDGTAARIVVEAGGTIVHDVDGLASMLRAMASGGVAMTSVSSTADVLERYSARTLACQLAGVLDAVR